MANKN